MAISSPSTTWSGVFDRSSLSADHGDTDGFWSKGMDGTLDKLDDFESNLIHDHGIASSAASTSSDSDCFPTASMHQLPAWSTESSHDLSAGNFLNRDDHSSGLLHQTSPGDAISPSGMFDMQQNGTEANEDVWFIPSPESGALPILGHSLQRKKRIHFAAGNGLPSSSGLNGSDSSLDLENGIGSPGAGNSALKSYKSVPNLTGRRISSGYTARLEDLLAEMGWPKNSETDTASSEAGDATIQGINAATDATLSSTPSNGSLASGMPQHSSNSALYQRRAESREGIMPTPAPVAVPKRAEDASGCSAPTTSVEQTDAENAGSSSTRARSNTVDTLSNLAAVQSTMTQQRTAALAAQQHRLQQMSASVSANGSSHGAVETFDKDGNKIPLNAATMESPSSISPNQQLLFASPSTTGSARPATASSGSNTTELATPVTPFVGMTLGGGSTADNLQWQNPHGFLLGSGFTGGSAAELAFMQQFAMQQKKENGVALSDDYLNSLNNSLGLCGVPSVAAPATVVKPTAVLDPATFSSMFGMLPSAGHASAHSMPATATGVISTPQSVLQPTLHTSHVPTTPQQYQQRLIFPPQQQKVVPVGTSAFNTRPRAGTAMAALGSGAQNATPRHMRSTPNMALSPSASMDGSQYSVSLTSTPVKSLRKIASNRRLNGMTGVTPDSPMHGALADLPSSPISPSKRRAGTLSASRSMGNLGAAVAASSSTFEFINYGIEDADELCSAVAPSGSYKIPLKGYGEEADDDDEDDLGAGFDAGSPGTDSDSLTRSPRRSGGRRARSSTNRSGPRWEDPNAPPLPTQGTDAAASGRSLKRQKSESNMMLSGRRKSPSMSNLRRAG